MQIPTQPTTQQTQLAQVLDRCHGDVRRLSGPSNRLARYNTLRVLDPAYRGRAGVGEVEAAVWQYLGCAEAPELVGRCDAERYRWCAEWADGVLGNTIFSEGA